MKTVTLMIILLLGIVVSTLSYKVIHQSYYHHRHQHHQYNDKIHDSNNMYKKISTIAFLAKADEIFERRNKTEIFNLAYSDDEPLDECSLDGDCNDTPNAWTGQKENSSKSRKSDDKNDKTPIWLSDDDNDKNEHTPKGKLYPINYSHHYHYYYHY
jgi:hypothetical protein